MARKMTTDQVIMDVLENTLVIVRSQEAMQQNIEDLTDAIQGLSKILRLQSERISRVESRLRNVDGEGKGPN